MYGRQINRTWLYKFKFDFAFLHKKSANQNLSKGVKMYVKILELSIWAKKHKKTPLDSVELYRMYNNGLARCKHESYLCLKVSALRSFSENEGIEENVKNISKKWLNILHEFKNDTRYHLSKQVEQNELQKMRNYFENLEVQK